MTLKLILRKSKIRLETDNQRLDKLYNKNIFKSVILITTVD
jgi:hypothetical protein